MKKLNQMKIEELRIGDILFKDEWMPCVTYVIEIGKTFEYVAFKSGEVLDADSLAYYTEYVYIGRLQYQINVQWSERNQKYIAYSPEWNNSNDGDTYEQAITNMQISIIRLMQVCEEVGKPFPKPNLFVD